MICFIGLKKSLILKEDSNGFFGNKMKERQNKNRLFQDKFSDIPGQFFPILK